MTVELAQVDAVAVHWDDHNGCKHVLLMTSAESLTV